MENGSYTLVVQSYGNENEYRRVVLSILSFYSNSSSNIKCILFTDNIDWFKSYFEDLPITYVLLTKYKIKEMRGAIDFTHRMKIAMIEEAFKMTDTNLLYVDSDTFFTSDPTPFFSTLSSKDSYMHQWEYKFEYLKTLSLPAGKPFIDFIFYIENNILQLCHGNTIEINSKDSSWNAGVLILHREHQKFLPDVYKLTEQFYPNTKNHASEQYAFSIILERNTNLQPCNSFIEHYWYNIKKKIVDEFLERELSKIANLEFGQKKIFILSTMVHLPVLFETHLFTLKDNAIQAFNNNQFTIGLKWSWKALLKGGIKDFIFIKDILYHIKNAIRLNSWKIKLR